MALQVVDRAIQNFGAEGLSQDQELASSYANLRTLRLADVSPSPPDFLSKNLLTRCELGTWCCACRSDYRKDDYSDWPLLHRFTSNKSVNGNSNARPLWRSEQQNSSKRKRISSRSMVSNHTSKLCRSWWSLLLYITDDLGCGQETQCY